MKKSQLPIGVQDALPGRQRGIRDIVDASMRVFYRWGYDEIATPNIEYMDVFSGHAGNYEPEQLFKLADKDGSILALRPDFTLPLSRIAASKMGRTENLRLCCAGPVYRYDGWEPAGGLRECTQVGVEWMGADSVQADAELVALAITTLREIGLEDFQIELGQVAFFKGLIAQAGFTGDQAEQLRLQVEAKNTLAVEMLMQQSSASQALMNTIREVPALYGGAEILDKAAALSANEGCAQAVNNLRQIWETLCLLGMEKYISIDLGMVNSLNYYTGMILRGISRHVGFPILTGGRYDTLCAEFGRARPATGFAFPAETVQHILENRQTETAKPQKSYLVWVDPECMGAAFAAFEGMRAQGQRVEIFYGRPEDTLRYARERQACAARYDAKGFAVTGGGAGE